MNEAKLLIHLDYISEGVILIDEQFCIKFMNRIVLKWLQEELNSFYGSNLVKSFPELESKKFFKRFEKIFSSNAPVVLSSLIHKQFINIGKEPDQLMLQECMINPFELENKKYAMICLQDVTGHTKSLQRVKSESRKLQTLADKKLSFLSSISHDLRTPLNGIIGTLDLFEDQKLNKHGYEHLDTIRTCSNYLVRLINDFLDISKIETNNLIIEQRKTFLSGLVSDVGKLFDYEFSKKSIELKIVHNYSRDINIFIDDLRLKQILINLIGNAIKFTHIGSVELKVELVENTLCLEVTDTGIGIPKDDFKKVFETFGQVERLHRGGSEGSGLGLSIVNSLVNKLDGKIQFESEIGKGTKFRIEVPCQVLGQASSNEASTTVKKNQNLSFLNVLVAEDNLINQQIIKKFLKKLNIDADYVVNGQDAVDSCLREEYDLVLMDNMMPVMSGAEAAELIIEKLKDDRPILVAVSANALTEDHVKFKETGFDSILSKPYTFSEFHDLVNSFEYSASNLKKTS